MEVGAPEPAGTPPVYAPPPRARLKARLAYRLLSVFGWRLRFAGLPGPCGVLVAYPHTSNWDFCVGIVAVWMLDLPLRWIGKQSLFNGVTGLLLGPLLRAWGGRPVARDQQSGAVAQLAALLRADPGWLALSPEGTRSRCAGWRSGFYHLARSLDVPVGVAFFDYPRREIGIAGFVQLSGEVAVDMQRVAALLAGRHGRHPQLESPVCLLEAATPPP